jgi:hypothetical protein
MIQDPSQLSWVFIQIFLVSIIKNFQINHNITQINTFLLFFYYLFFIYYLKQPISISNITSSGNIR